MTLLSMKSGNTNKPTGIELLQLFGSFMAKIKDGIKTKINNVAWGKILRHNFLPPSVALTHYTFSLHRSEA
jgi:hypothetical protein